MRRLEVNSLFESESLHHDLAATSARGGLTTITAQAIQFVLRMAGTMVLARLLTPADFGVIGMVLVVVGFAEMFKDAGLSMATVQRDRISHAQVSNLFWLNVLLSAALGLCILAGSPLVAWFYGRPELTLVTAVLSCSFILTGLTIQHSALLRRHMRYGTLAAIGVASQAINLIVVVLLALEGWRYWALVGGSLATAFATVLLTLFFCPWVPGRVRKGTDVRHMLFFGGNLTGFTFMNYFARNADNVLIGKFLGADSLGFYSKAYGLLMLPITQITGPIAAVAIPTLSRLQNDHDRFRRYFYQAITVIAFITMPMIALMAALSSEIILLVLGPQWTESAPIFKVLAFAALFQPVINPVGWVYVSLGQTERMLRWGFFAVPIIVISFAIGLPWGVYGVALSYTICSLLLTVPSIWYAFLLSPLSIRRWLAAIQKPILLSLYMFIAIELFKLITKLHNPIMTLALAAVVSLCFFGVLFACWPSLRIELISIVKVLHILRRPTVLPSNHSPET